MTWIYRNQPVLALPEDCVGFVYVISNLFEGRHYIGKKLGQFSKTKYKMHTQKNGVKVRKKIKSTVASDWQDYWGSSKELLEDIERLGRGHFRREILYFCKTKAECSYIEAKEQFIRGALEKSEYYNGHVMVRVHKNHILGKL
jgi:hypothetical protein